MFSLEKNEKLTMNSIDLADIYEALYAYEATDSGDLSFQAGERITVLKRDGDWWTGKIGDRTGTFPNNYVQNIENVRSQEQNIFDIDVSLFSLY